MEDTEWMRCRVGKAVAAWPAERWEEEEEERRRKALACGAQVRAWHSPLPNPAGSKQPSGAGCSCGV